MLNYLSLLNDVLENGVKKEDRTGTGTVSCFGKQLKFDLNDGFPLLTTKKMNLHIIACELLWFLKGDTNVRWLQENGCHIWDEWADEDGPLGPVYGKQWTDWNGFNQIDWVCHEIKVNPDSRRLIVSAWNVSDLHRMALVPCHMVFQFYVSNGKLSCQLYQRSADLFLGVPYNIASYALLTHMMARVCGLEVGNLILCFGDCHIYNNHIEVVNEQLKRKVCPHPTLKLTGGLEGIDKFSLDDFKLESYHPHGRLYGSVSV